MKNKIILQAQQRFKSESHNVFTEKIYKIAASSNNDQKIQSTDTIEICIYGMSKDLVSEKKHNKTIQKIINFDAVTKTPAKRA